MSDSQILKSRKITPQQKKGITMHREETVSMLRAILNRLARLEDDFYLVFEKQVISAKRELRQQQKARQDTETLLGRTYTLLGLPSNTSRPLVRAGIHPVQIPTMSDADLLSVRNLGQGKLNTIREWQERTFTD